MFQANFCTFPNIQMFVPVNMKYADDCLETSASAWCLVCPDTACADECILGASFLISPQS